MTDEEYVAWSEIAMRERQRYLDREIAGEELITRIIKELGGGYATTF